MALFLLGLLIVVGSLVAAVWRVHWLRGTLRTKAEVLRIPSPISRLGVSSGRPMNRIR